MNRSRYGLKILGWCCLMLLLGYVMVQARNQQLVSEVNHPKWSYSASIYEVNIRQYTPEGTFRAFEKRLPEIKALGTDIIWLMPIHPIGKLNRKGRFGSYYSVADYLAVNPEFGTAEDFRALVKTIHQMGMRVILDWVANHTAWDHAWTQTHPDYYTRDSLGNLIAPVADWSDVIDLNYENRDLWKSMTEALVYWIREYDIDGYRCDVAAMVPTEFWNQARAELDKIKPVFMLAEAHEPELHIKAFDMTYNWQFKDLANNIAAGKQTAEDFWKLAAKQQMIYPENSFRMSFITNHDENTWHGTVGERLGVGCEAFSVLITLMEGMPLIYSGQEAGLDKRLQFFERDPIEWKQTPLRPLFSRLLELKKKNRALWNGNRGGRMIRISDQPGILAFLRHSGKHRVVAVVNLSDSLQTVTLTHDKLKGKYRELAGNQKIKLGDRETMELAPWQYRVFYTY
ncbi:MAG: alpha-glucosidase C-terminal domain-containing protein [Candidatus Delongbacteria bacterium]|nr:alpha-glucosidase C-terminal domain-containing protein [Candidatus Delongbacteria bacterium]